MTSTERDATMSMTPELRVERLAPEMIEDGELSAPSASLSVVAARKWFLPNTIAPKCGEVGAK